MTYVYVTYADTNPNTTCDDNLATILWNIVCVGSCFFICCWNALLLIHIKLCGQVKNELQDLINTMKDSIFSPKNFQIRFEKNQKIIQLLGYYLLLLNFFCITYVAGDVVLITALFQYGYCEKNSYCSWVEIYFATYKIVFFFSS